MIKVYETSLRIPKIVGNVGLLENLAHEVRAHLPPNTLPVRFAVTQSDDTFYHAELGVLEHEEAVPSIDPIFRFSKRPIENTCEFNAVLLVPTGIGALIGGHAGDATPVSRLLASICDNLITHPNVVNASDINEMTENTLYAEGSVVSRLLMGTIGLQKVRANRVLTVIEKHPTDELFVNGAINAVNAARASAGLDCSQILVLDPAMRLMAEYSSSGRAVGKVDKLENLFVQLRACRSEYDSVAITSIIKIPSRALHKQYFESNGKMINPWGGVEAIFTHTISSLLNVQSAHSPMIEDQLVSNMDVGVVDARQAAEAISFTYMQCILKGLQRAPRIVADRDAMRLPGVITAADVSCLVIPGGCIGLPTLAALEQGIPVIAVRENTNIMKNDLTTLPWARNQLYIVENYLEALGVMAALKSGVAIDTLKRPLANARNSENPFVALDVPRDTAKQGSIVR
jgi:CBS domain-containing protein